MLNLSIAKPNPINAIEVRTQDKNVHADLPSIAAISQN
jgi:hypothetical protein